MVSLSALTTLKLPRPRMSAAWIELSVHPSYNIPPPTTMAQLWGHHPTEPRRQGMERLTRHESCKKRSRTEKQKPVNSWHWGTTLHLSLCVRPRVPSVSSPVRIWFLLIATQRSFLIYYPSGQSNFVHDTAQREQNIWDFVG